MLKTPQLIISTKLIIDNCKFALKSADRPKSSAQYIISTGFDENTTWRQVSSGSHAEKRAK